MKRLSKLALSMLSLVTLCFVAVDDVAASQRDIVGKSSYVDYMPSVKRSYNLVKDFKVVPNSDADQSAKIQSAIDEVSQRGGGKLYIDKGTYRFINVCMRSNVHIVVDPGAVLKPYYGKFVADNRGEYNVGLMMHFSPAYRGDHGPDYVENVSIRGVDGKQFTVDFSDLPRGEKYKVRFVAIRMAKNYSVEDVLIKDNYTKFCPIIFVPGSGKGMSSWKVSRPTNGQVRNCSILNANSGYGLCQFHGCDDVFLENIYAKGGITLRLEPDIHGDAHGVHNVRAKGVRNENGRAGVLMQPHTAKNGTVKVQDVWTKSTGFGVLIRKGFIDNQNKNNPNATIGYYADDSEIIRVHSIYGIDAQVDKKDVWVMEPDEERYAKFRVSHFDSTQSIDGPSVVAVFDDTQGSYKVKVSEITSEGFSHHQNSIMYNADTKGRVKQRWPIANSLPYLSK